MSEQRNIVIAIVLSIAIFVGWSYLFPPAPNPHKPQPGPGTTAASTAPNAPPALPGGVVQSAPVAAVSRDQLLARSTRVPIDAPDVSGSINLTGARLDDLRLTKYHETPSDGSPTITLLSPQGLPDAYYSEFGWTAAQGSKIALPGADTVWTVESGNQLSPDAPVTLKWDNGQGLVFRITYAIDKHYMFTVVQNVENDSTAEATLTPYAVVSRYQGATGTNSNIWFLHEGFVGWIDGSLKNVKWKKLDKDGGFSVVSTGGWMGFADKYWLAALAPPQSAKLTASVGIDHPGGIERFATAYELQPVAVAPGAKSTTESHFFAGAKEVKTVGAYKDSLGITRFDLAIDWGWFRFMTEPVFYALDFFGHLTGNFGIAILLVTLCFKILFFPLANKSYETMAKMKKLQPQLKAIQERYKDDKAELPKQTAQIYQKEKINPLAGCLPMFLQIPVFYSLYNVLFITIEMRQAPFFGWIHDLSAKDPTTIFNLFGLLPYHPPAFLMLGAWPLIMGVTMFVQTSLTPSAATDPTQKMIFMFMPIMFTFMLASFPAGLVIYWTWNNLLTIVQQSVIMQRMGTPVDFLSLPGVSQIARLLGAKRKPPDKVARRIPAAKIPPAKSARTEADTGGA
jgi:YidC/Oxa1 family membrane protein insertase